MPPELWPHQREAIPRLLAGHYMLAWEPGCGKTVPVLLAAKALNGPVLYICPAAIREQIADVAMSLGFDERNILVIKTRKTPFDPIKFLPRLVICSYDQASETPRWKQFFGIKWAALILDEAHNLKNQSASRTRAVYGAKITSPGALYRKAERVWPMTGTPVLRDPLELWTHCSRLFPDMLKPNAIQTQKQWLNRYCHFQETAYGPRITGGKNIPELNKLLKPYMTHLTLEQAQPGMPDLSVDLDRVDVGEISRDGLPEEALAELDRLLARAQIDLDDPLDGQLQALVPPLATLRRRLGVAKANHVAEYTKNELFAGQPRVALFYFHEEVGDLLEFQLQRFKPVRIDGKTTNKHRTLQGHITNPDSRVALLQISAAGVGLDGLQHVCNRAILAEYLWSPGLNDQAIKRVYRGGQKLPVRATYIVARGSHDDRVLEVLRRREKLIKEILE